MSRANETKLRALNDESLSYGDGYRGHRFVQWREIATKRKTKRIFLVYAAGCRFCGQHWGWTHDLEKAIRVACAMGVQGCPHCEKRLSPRKFAALQAHRRSDKVKVCVDVFIWNGSGFGCRYCKKRIGKGTYRKVEKVMAKRFGIQLKES